MKNKKNMRKIHILSATTGGNNFNKKIKMTTKKKPGPKPKSLSNKARGKHLSFPPKQADFLDGLEEASYFMQKLLVKSPEYKEYLKKLKVNTTN